MTAKQLATGTDQVDSKNTAAPPESEVVPTQDVVVARPTKEFFVRMLVRDIELLPAVVDLVDNSVDGARRHRSGDFQGLWVRIDANDTRFSIVDNCGGIPLDRARRYAFRLGRDEAGGSDPHSIGQFGVGMKRAVFKLGTYFTVDSKTTTDSFSLAVDVTEWLTRPDDWDLVLNHSAVGERRPADETGTALVVTRLHDDVKETFSNKAWQSQLANELRLKHRDALTRGMRIELNGKVVEATRLDIIDKDPFQPGQRRLTLGRSSDGVKIALIVGISRSVPEAGGWYVFCNGRMVLGPDQSRTTVWLGKGNQGLPKYHDEYGRFRGYAFFDADNAAALPWTTTKVGVDQDSRVWMGSRELMIDLSKPVIRFLRVLDRQRDAGDDTIYEQIEAIEPVPLQRVHEITERTFAPPPMKMPAVDQRLTRVSHYELREDVVVAKRLLGVTTNEQVGKRTFEYFLDAEDIAR
jgi:hypothetical protein